MSVQPEETNKGAVRPSNPGSEQIQRILRGSPALYDDFGKMDNDNPTDLRVTLLTHTPDPERVLAYVYGKPYHQDPDIDRVGRCLTKYDPAHDSGLEFVDYIFDIEGMSRVTWCQLEEHRLASHMAWSGRYNETDITKGFTIPPSIVEKGLEAEAMAEIERQQAFYQRLRDAGIMKQDARYFLGFGQSINVTWKGNLRTLCTLWRLRHPKVPKNHAQWEFQTLAEMMYNLVRPTLPNLHPYIEEYLGIKR